MKTLIAITMIAAATAFQPLHAAGSSCKDCCKDKACVECCGDKCAECSGCNK